jgi:hypothetical protein
MDEIQEDFACGTNTQNDAIMQNSQHQIFSGNEPFISSNDSQQNLPYTNNFIS